MLHLAKILPLRSGNKLLQDLSTLPLLVALHSSPAATSVSQDPDGATSRSQVKLNGQ